jgi:hypothetical protein
MFKRLLSVMKERKKIIDETPFVISYLRFYIEFGIASVIGMAIFFVFGYLLQIPFSIRFVLYGMMVIIIIGYLFAYGDQYQNYLKSIQLKRFFLNKVFDNLLFIIQIISLYSLIIIIQLYSRFFMPIDIVLLVVIVVISRVIRLVVVVYRLYMIEFHLSDIFQSLYAVLLAYIHIGIFVLLPSTNPETTFLVSSIVILILLIAPTIYHFINPQIYYTVFIVLVLFVGFGLYNHPVYSINGEDSFRYYGTNEKKYTTYMKPFEYVEKMIFYDGKLHIMTNETIQIYDEQFHLVNSYYIESYDVENHDYSTFMIYESNRGVVLQKNTPDAIYEGEVPYTYDGFEIEQDDIKTLYLIDENGELQELFVIWDGLWNYPGNEYIFQFTDEKGVYYTDRPNAFMTYYDENGSRYYGTDLPVENHYTDTFYTDNGDCETDEQYGFACIDVYSYRTSTSYFTYDFHSITLYHDGYLQYNQTIYDIDNQRPIPINGLDKITNNELEEGQITNVPRYDSMLFEVREEGFIIIGKMDSTLHQYFVASVDFNGNIIDYMITSSDYIHLNGDQIVTVDYTEDSSGDIVQEETNYIFSYYDIDQFFQVEKRPLGINNSSIASNLVIHPNQVIYPLIALFAFAILFKKKHL